MTTTIHHGDCLDVLRTMPDNSVHAIVTDPPYGLANTTPDQVAETIVKWVSGERDYLPSGRGFMNRAWDAFVPPVAVWDEAMRVLKPGGHVLAFAGTRTVDLMALGLRLAGFDIRDSVAWLYGSGFPKSKDVGKQLARMEYAQGERAMRDTLAAKQWEGWGSSTKPAHEPIVMARKPFKGTLAANVLEHGTGALNIDATRVNPGETIPGGGGLNAGGMLRFNGFSTMKELEDAATRGDKTPNGRDARATLARIKQRPIVSESHTSGRWPANVILDEHMAQVLDQQSGWQKDGVAVRRNRATEGVDANPNGIYSSHMRGPQEDQTYGGGGGASRFFYVAKAPKRERPVVDGVSHPTTKPLTLMRYLIRMVTPPGGTILDPFAGSGTTVEAAMLEGFDCIGIEREAEYLPLIHERIRRATEQLATEDPEQGSFSFEETA